MSFELFIALRYLREGRSQTLLILAGVSVGVGVIVFLSSLINGLQASLVERTLGAQAHIVVRPQEQLPRPLTAAPGAAVAAQIEQAPQRLVAIREWQRARRAVAEVPGVRATTPTVAGSAFIGRGAANRSVALRGVDPESFVRVIGIERKIVAGSFRVSGSEAVIGAELARVLGARPGDKVRIRSAEGISDVFTVSGVFDLGNKDVNERWVLIGLRAAQHLLQMIDGVSTIEAQVDEIFGVEPIAAQVAERTGLIADSWMKINRELMIGLRSQSSSRYMIQFFVIVAVALGIASVLAVAVVQKSREIGILRAVGTSMRRVMRVFLLQGLILGMAGSAIGSAIGAGLAMLFQTMALNPDGSPTFPVDLSPSLFLWAALVAIGTGLVGAAAPARRAARLDPATAIRYG